MTIATLSTSVQQCINNFAAALIRNKTLILQCIGFTFLWGLIAHGYMFANNLLVYDSLWQFVDTAINKAQTGRVLVPVYNFVRSEITMPWLIGILALFYIGLAAFLIVKIFNIKNSIFIFLTTGILTVNVTTIAITATFISDLDADMFAMLLSVLSVYLWKKRNFLWGILPLAVSMGLYQSYLSTAMTLIIFVLILELLQNKDFNQIIKKGLKAILMIVGAGVLYLCFIKIACYLLEINLHSGRYNSLDTALTMSPLQILQSIASTYIATLRMIVLPPSICWRGLIFIMRIFIIITAFIFIVRQIIYQHIPTKKIICLLGFIILLPLIMNIARVLTNNMSHDIMHYALWLADLFTLLLIFSFNSHRNTIHYNFIQGISIMSILLIFIIAGLNVRLANTAYMIRSVERDAHLSLFTKVISDIEEQEGYIVGQTQVAFIGIPFDTVLPDNLQNNRALNLFCMRAGFPADQSYLSWYFKYVLVNSTKLADVDVNILQQKPEVIAMPLYPASGSMQYVDNILVVKLGDKGWN